jgi:hypothetical protein
VAKAVTVTAATGTKLAQRAKREIPAIPRHQEVDTLLRQHAQRIETGYMDFMELAREAIENKYYERFKDASGQIYLDAEPYFQDRIGISYRSVRRRLQTLEGVLRLPAEEQGDAKRALAALGSHKAAEVARIMGRDQGSPWRDVAEMATQMTEDALREEVSARLEAKPRGLPGAPGERFLRMVLAQVPPDVREHTEAVFRGVMKRFELTNAMAAFLVLVDLGGQELAAWEAQKK